LPWRAAAFDLCGTKVIVPDACLDFAIRDNATLGVSHTGQFGNGARDSGAKANFNVRF